MNEKLLTRIAYEIYEPCFFVVANGKISDDIFGKALDSYSFWLEDALFEKDKDSLKEFALSGGSRVYYPTIVNTYLDVVDAEDWEFIYDTVRDLRLLVHGQDSSDKYEGKELVKILFDEIESNAERVNRFKCKKITLN